ncbi:MAG: helix-hairpin-helix domain-containing protein, partial [Methylotenera sp.]|nr:helix-hairpin-helix domain-containing protein [Flavobacterium sp.]
MSFKTIQTYFKFSKEQRTGIFCLFVIIISLQLVYYFVDFARVTKEDPAKQKWLSLQSGLDSMKRSSEITTPKIYLFNPNFITDYKGYKLGMTVKEIDRLLAFRKKNKF